MFNKAAEGETPLSDNVQAGPFRVGDTFGVFYLCGAASVEKITNVCKQGYFYYLRYRRRHQCGNETYYGVAAVAAEMDAEAARRLSTMWLHLQLNYKGMVFSSITRSAPLGWDHWDFERQVDWLERDIVPLLRDERERSHEQ